MIGNKYNKRHDKDESGKVDPCFKFRFDPSAGNCFNQKEDQSAAIQSRNRQQIEDTDIDRDKGEEGHDRRKSGRACFSNYLSSADRTGEIIDRSITGDQITE